MKQQVIVIHGGDAFDTYEDYFSFLKNYQIDQQKFDRKFRQKGWKEALNEKLGNDFEVLQPHMPNRENCRYAEWKIWFEKLIPFFDSQVVLIGHSMGGIFLAKYLSENRFPKKIIATFLIAPPHDDEGSEYTLADFALVENLDLLQEQSSKLFIFQSRDDKFVPFKDLEKYKKKLPNAQVLIFEDRGHFTDRELPEIVAEIKGLL